jgi:hypothetical protein
MDANRGAFIAVSAILAGREALDEGQAGRLYDALAADDRVCPAAVGALLGMILGRPLASNVHARLPFAMSSPRFTARFHSRRK